MSRTRAKVRWLLALGAVTAISVLHVGRLVHAGQAAPAAVKEIKLGTAKPGTMYAVTVAVKDPARVQGSDAVLATVKDAQGIIDSKWLHTADLDLYMTVQPRAAGPVTVSLSSSGAIPEISASARKIVQEAGAPAVIAAAPNGTWQNAQPFEFGQTIYGSDDERPYAPSRNEDGYAAMVKGFQWFRFTFNGEKTAAGLLHAQRNRPGCALRCRHFPEGERWVGCSAVQHRGVCLPGRGDAELSRTL